jgi:tellurite resistance protein TerC
VLPVSEHHHEGRFFTHERGRRVATPMVLALAAVVAADIAFAVDSIPAAFAITTDSFAIWAANAFALLGLRALFALVEELIRRFRYLDETIAVVLGIVGLKLLIEDVVHVGPVVSLLIVLAAFAIGITASVLADRRDPEGAAERRAEHEQQRPTPVG